MAQKTGQHVHELICIADAGADFSHMVEAVRAVAAVTALLPPRVALAQAREGPPVQVRGAVCYRGEVPPEVLAGLTPEERLFVAAARARVGHKHRPGDKLTWDTAGFTPPDSPNPPATGRL